MIDHAGCERALRHSVEVGGVWTFHQNASSGTFDLPHPPRSIAAGSRQNDGDGIGTDIFGQRMEKQIDRQRERVGAFLVVEQQPPVANDHLFLGRQQVNVIRFDLDLVFSQSNGPSGRSLT